MKTLIKVLVVLAICVAGLGFYRGWFSLSGSGRDADSNKVKVSLTVDPDKMNEDTEKVGEKTAELTDKAAEEAKELGDWAKGNANSDDE